MDKVPIAPTRKVGLEFEISDINTNLASSIVYEHFSQDYSIWKNIDNIYTKPDLDYSIWNCIGDSTIYNSDGSRCVVSYLDNNGSIKMIDYDSVEDMSKSRGAEIISPPSNDTDQLVNDLYSVLEKIKNNGGKISRNLDNALHIHIDASDLTFEQVRLIPRKCLQFQQELTKLYTFNGMPVPLYTIEQIEELESCIDIESYKKLYFTRHGVINYAHPGHRFVVNIGPWLKNDLNYKTIEFRAFSASENQAYTKSAIDLSIKLMNFLIYDIELTNVSKAVELIENTHHI